MGNLAETRSGCSVGSPPSHTTIDAVGHLVDDALPGTRTLVEAADRRREQQQVLVYLNLRREQVMYGPCYWIDVVRPPRGTPSAVATGRDGNRPMMGRYAASRKARAGAGRGHMGNLD